MGNLKGGINSLFSGGKEQEETKKSSVSKNLSTLDFETDVTTEPFFKKAKALKKIILKHTNKTFTFLEEWNMNKYEIEIKKEICKIFSYILDIRQDFLIDNIVEYVISKFPFKLKEAK